MSYGEETITETNLLEIRRRHPHHVRVRTFPKQVEATNGADWEWRIVGLRRTLGMRVQAKRLQRNGVLKVRHTVKSSGKEQRDLLIAGSMAEGMKPVYCIYCTEQQRTLWKEVEAVPELASFETGCLLAAAGDVPGTTTRLDEIEENCWPWHHLFGGGETARAKVNPEWDAPTIRDLNDETGQDFDRTGVQDTTEEDLERLEPGRGAESDVAQSDGERLRRLGIRRMMVVDVRGDLDPDERRGR